MIARKRTRNRRKRSLASQQRKAMIPHAWTCSRHLLMVEVAAVRAWCLIEIRSGWSVSVRRNGSMSARSPPSLRKKKMAGFSLSLEQARGREIRTRAGRRTEMVVASHPNRPRVSPDPISTIIGPGFRSLRSGQSTAWHTSN